MTVEKFKLLLSVFPNNADITIESMPHEFMLTDIRLLKPNKVLITLHKEFEPAISITPNSQQDLQMNIKQIVDMQKSYNLKIDEKSGYSNRLTIDEGRTNDELLFVVDSWNTQDSDYDEDDKSWMYIPKSELKNIIDFLQGKYNET